MLILAFIMYLLMSVAFLVTDDMTYGIGTVIFVVIIYGTVLTEERGRK